MIAPAVCAPRRMHAWHGESAALRARAADYLRRLSAPRLLWVGREAAAPWRCETARQAMRHLGSECDVLVFDATEALDVNAFGALLGTLVGGGTLLLLLPPRERALSGGRFLRRFIGHLDANAWSARSPRAGAPVGQVASIADPAALTGDQSRAIAAVLRVARGHRRRPLVLTADRGRGKSAALGIAAARLVEGGAQRILVTAPSRPAVASLFDQLRRLQGARAPDGVVFLAPDDLMERLPATDLLLVDEAAALPVSVLTRLLQHYARIAFATTVHGYEGSGQGFSIRFRQVLDATTPQWSQLQMHDPIRWTADDPLEAFGFAALLLDAEPVAVATLGDPRAEDCEFQRLDRDVLAGDEARLREVFGLLVLAHYQTRPSDLRRLLDDPDLELWTADYRGHAVATALIVNEGALPADLGRAVAAGTRRIGGHLLPQTLAAHAGFEAATRLRYARVMRIAVHPELQRRGIGSGLLLAVQSRARAAHLDLLGCSFGLRPDALDFWCKAGLRPVRVGLTRDAASGTHSGVLLQDLSAAGADLLGQARRHFAEHLPLVLADGLQDLPARLAAQLAQGLPAEPLAGSDRATLAAFAAGQRDYAGVLAPLVCFVWRLMVSGALVRAEPQARDVLIRKVIQRHNWSSIAAALGLAGRRAVLAALRAAVGAGLAALPPRNPD